MKLNIYKKVNGKREIAKTYEASEYDILFGTIEDLIKDIDLDKVQDVSDAMIMDTVGRLMVNSFETIKDLLQDIFDGLTEDEIRCTTVKEVARVLVDVIIYTVTDLQRSFAWGGEKNVKAAKSR